MITGMDQKTFRQTLRRAFWILFGIAVLLAAILILEVRFLVERAAWVEHTDQVITLSQRIYRNRVDQETGLRAYVLTGDTRFLDPFYEGRRRALDAEPELRRLVSDNPEQTARNEKAIQAFAAWSAWADKAIAMTKAREHAGDVTFQLQGKELMDEYRRLRTDFLEHEQQLREERLARSRRTLEVVNASIIAFAILFVLGFALLGRKQLSNLSQSFTEALNSAREQRDWLHTTVTSIGDAVISTDADGRITLMNPVAEKLTGWTLHEAQGKSLADVFRIVDQETRQIVENPVDKVRRLNRVAGLANHTILISKNGEEIAIDDSGAPIFGPDGALTGIVLVFRDVTEQRAAQRAFARLAAIVEFSGDAILAKSLEGVVQTWNAGAERLFGYKADEIVGKPVTVLVPADRFNEEEEILQRIRQGQPSKRVETVRLAKDGTPIRVSVGVSPVKDREGRVVGASNVIHDISELAAAREALVREKELLATTLASIGDAVIVTDAEGAVTFLNSEAERLTAWKTSDAAGRPLPEVFNIINEQTRQRVENPVEKVLRLGGVVGLANHTLLLARDGREIPIDDSAAPIRQSDGRLFGVVLVFRDFTERKRLEETLREGAQRATASQERLLGLINSAMDAVIAVDARQRIVLFNPAAEKMFGCSGLEAKGESLDRFIPVRSRAAHRRHIEDFGQTGVTTRSMSRPGALWGMRHNGDEFPIEATISQVEVGGQKIFTAILRDITERKKAETKLAEQASLLELTSDAIIVRDESGHIAYWNKGAEDLYGWTQKEALGKVTHDLLRTKFPRPLAEIVDWVRKEKRWRGELVHTRRNGEEVVVLSRWALVHHEPDAADPPSLMEINTNVTRGKQLEAAVQSNERLALAGRLSASIAHEIHNPLDTVANALFLIDQRIDGQRETRQLVTTAQREVQRVTEITKNMLSLHRESRAASVVKLSELLEGVVALIEETIAKGRRNIDVVPGFAGEIEAFPSELRQVFTNVIKNAVEATADGGEIKIYSEAAQESGRDGVSVRVVDDGVGISEQMQSKLFSPFVTTKEETGTGLGLWVSRMILEKHRGSIRLSSGSEPEHRGTTVSIFLPLKVSSQKTAELSSTTRA